MIGFGIILPVLPSYAQRLILVGAGLRQAVGLREGLLTVSVRARGTILHAWASEPDSNSPMVRV